MSQGICITQLAFFAVQTGFYSDAVGCSIRLRGAMGPGQV